MIDDAVVTLPDGRHLGVTTIGAPIADSRGDSRAAVNGGSVVVYHHGAPGGRLELVSLDEAFAAVGVCLITPDRPGYGRSSPKAGRTTASFVDDVVALADDLGIDRFAVAGLSSGGPYAVACAALLGDRVTGAVIAAGNTDMSWPDSHTGYLDSELELMALADVDTAVAFCAARYGADGAGFFDGELDLGPTDNAFLATDGNEAALFAGMTDAFRQGVIGYAHDIWVQGRAWSFDPAAITCPVIVVHGADDRLVPIAHSRHTASLIPGAELRILPGVGHLSLTAQLPALTADVTPGVRHRT